jgi:metallo-beta-lactamase family protein
MAANIGAHQYSKHAYHFSSGRVVPIVGEVRMQPSAYLEPPMSINLIFHGAAGTVTGSKYLLELKRPHGGTTRILLDCGMFQGEALRNGDEDPNRHFGFDPRTLDAVVLSHAHIDHSGLLPRLVAEGFAGPIWSTPATDDLCAIMLVDSAHIQEYDHEWEMKKARDNGGVPDDGPLYRVADVAPTMELFRNTGYNEPVVIAEGVELTFTDTGHILGSAAIHLRITDGDRTLRLSFTGDVGRYVDRLLPDPAPFPQADVVICESTYGDRQHSPVAEAEEMLLRHVTETCVTNGGRLIIPAFSVGKTQEVLYTLNMLSNAGRLPRIPVFVDSPLAISATDISRKYAGLLREAVREQLEHDPDLFSFPGLEILRTPESSKALNDRTEPCIIISASGMMEAGRVRHHLRHALPDPRNAVLVVGFCAPGTLGDRLLQGAHEVGLFGQRIPVKARILRMDFYSAHADSTELVRFLRCQDPAQVQRVFLVHGVDESRNALKESLSQEGFQRIHLPHKGERIVLSSRDGH